MFQCISRKLNILCFNTYFTPTTNEINLLFSLLFFFFFFFYYRLLLMFSDISTSPCRVRSVWFHLNADRKEVVSHSPAPVNFRHNTLQRTFDCGHEKGSRSQAKEDWRNSRTSATRCRRIDEATNKKTGSVCRSGSRRIKSPLVPFNLAGVYTCHGFARVQHATQCLKVLGTHTHTYTHVYIHNIYICIFLSLDIFN